MKFTRLRPEEVPKRGEYTDMGGSAWSNWVKRKFSRADKYLSAGRVDATLQIDHGASGGLVFDSAKRCIIGVNIAILAKNDLVYGFVTNPNFGPIKEWLTSIGITF